METKYGFHLMSIDEFETYIAELRVARTIIYLQQHHTWNPDYALFNGENHFERQRAMRDHHVNNNGWSDIGQHFTTFPDGTIMSGRGLERSPACIYGNNSSSICIENLGNFDVDGDDMTNAQKMAIVRASAVICSRFNIPVNTDRIIYHHWFDLRTGERNNGTRNNKSCPGTNFFRGNKVEDCKAYFIPLVKRQIGASWDPPVRPLIKYVSVTAVQLNIRKKATAQSDLVEERPPALLGAILRVYDERNNWLRISSSKQHWVSGRYTREVKRATVKASKLNVRNQPSSNGLGLGYRVEDQEVFVHEQQGNWSRISVAEEWVYSQYLEFDRPLG